MSYAAKMVRETAISDALRAADEALGQARPSTQALAILAALRALRDDRPVVVLGSRRVDYMEQVRDAAIFDWREAEGVGMASRTTPIGALSAEVRRAKWAGKRGERAVWVTVYFIDGEPITVTAMKAAGLARRPTTKRRRTRAEIQRASEEMTA